jgi:hypothetical protein
MSIRGERLNMADKRAMEEQHERMNPVGHTGATPSHGLSEYRGGSAVPSSGLSMFHGGGYEEDDMARMVGSGKKRKSRAKKAHEEEGKHMMEALEAHEREGEELDGSGHASEMREMGRHLGKHLMSLHGAGHHRDFIHGMIEGGGFFGNIGNWFKKVFGTVKNQFKDPNSILRGKILPIASKVAPVLSALGPYGMAASKALDYAQKGNELAKAHGLGRPRKGGVKTGQYEGAATRHFGFEAPLGGGAKAKRRPAGPDDGRRKRSAIVKKVMMEKGLGMIEASKYVKAHNLY